MNRPLLKKKDRRSERLIVRVTTAERKAMEKQAKDAGLKLSEWMRGKLLG